MTDNEMLIQSMSDNPIWIIGGAIIVIALLMHFLSNKDIPRIVLKENTYLKLEITVERLVKICHVTQVWCNTKGEDISIPLNYSLFKEEVKELCLEEGVDFEMGKIIIKQSY